MNFNYVRLFWRLEDFRRIFSTIYLLVHVTRAAVIINSRSILALIHSVSFLDAVFYQVFIIQ